MDPMNVDVASAEEGHAGTSEQRQRGAEFAGNLYNILQRKKIYDPMLAAEILNAAALLSPCVPEDIASVFDVSSVKNNPQIQIQMDTGLFWYGGLENGLNRSVVGPQQAFRMIFLDCYVDEVPYFSCGTTVWVIYGHVHEAHHEYTVPFLIALYVGKEKPSHVNFLRRFCGEAQFFAENRLVLNNGPAVQIIIRSFRCDTAGRSFIKGTCEHTSCHACHMCTMVANFSSTRHQNFGICDVPAPPRTDAAFRNGEYGKHHLRVSGQIIGTPLELLKPFDIVRQVPVGDLLHLIHLGAVKSYFEGVEAKYGSSIFAGVEQLVQKFERPCEYPALSRRLAMKVFSKKRVFWHKNELRILLDTTGILAIKQFVDEIDYRQYKALHWACVILNNVRYKHLLEDAERLLKAYVQDDFSKWQQVTLNSHNLSHIVEEAKLFGPPSCNSMYPVEDMLDALCGIDVGAPTPEQQLDSVLTTLLTKEATLRQTPMPPVDSPPRITHGGRRVEIPSRLELRADSSVDCWFLAQAGQDVSVVKFCKAHNGHSLQIIGYPLQQQEAVFDHDDFITEPPKDFNIFKTRDVESLGGEKEYHIDNVLCKALVWEQQPKCTYFVPMYQTFLDWKGNDPFQEEWHRLNC